MNFFKKYCTSGSLARCVYSEVVKSSEIFTPMYIFVKRQEVNFGLWVDICELFVLPLRFNHVAA